MTTASNPYRGFRYPPEIIQHAVWLYHCFSLSLRDVEAILFRKLLRGLRYVPRHAQRFLSTHSQNHLQLGRHRLTAGQHRAA